MDCGPINVAVKDRSMDLKSSSCKKAGVIPDMNICMPGISLAREITNKEILRRIEHEKKLIF